MKVPPEFTLSQEQWADANTALRQIRATVFIQEQGVPPELEWDDCDAQSVHILVRLVRTGEAVGTGRLLLDGHIGRMAVLKSWRGKGIGSAILGALLEIARQQQFPSVVLHAQTHAVNFYGRFGFEVTSDEFVEAGIPHRIMRLVL